MNKVSRLKNGLIVNVRIVCESDFKMPRIINPQQFVTRVTKLRETLNDLTIPIDTPTRLSSLMRLIQIRDSTLWNNEKAKSFIVL